MVDDDDMARQPASPPQMNISVTTAIKAGFFGAIGFFIAQLVLIPVILVLMLIFGVSIAGLGLAASKASSPAGTPTRWQSTPTPPGYTAQR